MTARDKFWCWGNEQYLVHKNTQQRLNNLLSFLGTWSTILSLCQRGSKVDQVFQPTGTRWRNNHAEAVTCRLLHFYTSHLFLLPFLAISPHLSPPPHPASISFHCVPGVTKLCYDTLQLLRCLLNYGRSLEATALMKHAARSHISPRRGETYCWGVNYSYSKYHSSHHAKTSDKKPPATSGLHTSLVGRINRPTTSQWKNTLDAKRRPPPSPCVLTIATVRKYSWAFLYHGDCWGYIWPDWNC